jgi:hypothetical protein
MNLRRRDFHGVPPAIRLTAGERRAAGWNKKLTNEAVNLLKISQITFPRDSKAVNMLKTGRLYDKSRQHVENKPVMLFWLAV